MLLHYWLCKRKNDIVTVTFNTTELPIGFIYVVWYVAVFFEEHLFFFQISVAQVSSVACKTPSFESEDFY